MSARRRRRQTDRSHPPRGLPWSEVHPTLDLHGETALSARARAERWLREHQRDGIRTVRIVTGRGLHSVGPPVLPGEVADLLGSLRGTVVGRFERDAGGGAFLVELKRPRSRGGGTRRGPSRAPTPPSDAELRRRAEDSLAELGISPTPELLAAEMERLARER